MRSNNRGEVLMVGDSEYFINWFESVKPKSGTAELTLFV
jgi:hypothetical protein